MNIKDKRLQAIYEFRNINTSSERDKLLDILLALMTTTQAKIICEELNIKIKG